MRKNIHPLVQDTHHIDHTACIAFEKHQVRTYNLFAG